MMNVALACLPAWSGTGLAVLEELDGRAAGGQGGGHAEVE